MPTFGRDTMTDTPGVLLDAHTPELGGPWVNVDGGHFGSAAITTSPANKLGVLTGVSSAIYVLSANPGNQDYTVQDDMTVESLAPIDSLALMLHSQNNVISFANQWYYAWYQGSSQRWVVIGHFGAGTFNQVLTVGQTYQRKFYTTGGGTTLKLDIDGVNVVSFVEGSPYPSIGWGGYVVTGGGTPGSDAVGYLSDNFLAYVGSPTPPPFVRPYTVNQQAIETRKKKRRLDRAQRGSHYIVGPPIPLSNEGGSHVIPYVK